MTAARDQRRPALLALGCAKKFRVLLHETADACERDHPRQCKPHPQRVDGIPRACAARSPHRPDCAEDAGAREGERHGEHRAGQLTHREPLVQRCRKRGREQQHGEGGGEHLREPLDAPEQVMDALRRP